MQTPAAHDASEEEPEPLNQVQHSKYKWQVARCLFLNRDRVDVKELCQRMSKPTEQSLRQGEEACQESET